MAKPPLSFLDYLSEAFHESPPIPGMGKMPVNKLACFGAVMLGFVNPGFWFAGAALEMGYLYMLSTDTKYQKVIQSRRINVVPIDKTAKINAMIMSLDKESADRLDQINLNLSEVKRLMDMDSTSGAGDFMKESKQQTLEQLPILFLKLLVAKNLSLESLKRTNHDRLVKQSQDLKKQFESPDLSEALSRSIRGTLDILEKRLENLGKAKENLQLIEMELNRIENQMQLVREEVALNRTPEGISSSIDRINLTLNETEEWISTHSEFLSRISGESPTTDLRSGKTSGITPAVIETPTVNEPETSAPPPKTGVPEQ